MEKIPHKIYKEREPSQIKILFGTNPRDMLTGLRKGVN